MLAAAERTDQHRKHAIARDERVTMTGVYNFVEKLRSGEALTTKERAIHEIAACGILKGMHDELDALVAEAYGWPWPMEREEILERLVALHDERVAEEKRGQIRWAEAVAAFKDADKKLVSRQSETFAMLGEVVVRDGRYGAVRAVA